jgi:hypothetical protein
VEGLGEVGGGVEVMVGLGLVGGLGVAVGGIRLVAGGLEVLVRGLGVVGSPKVIVGSRRVVGGSTLFEQKERAHIILAFST